MVSRVFIHKAARNEVTKAIDYYRDISPELSDDLLLKFREAVKEIAKQPKLFPIVRGNYRKINLERFPYKIIFRMRDNELNIVAFAHHKRNPHYWRKR